MRLPRSRRSAYRRGSANTTGRNRADRSATRADSGGNPARRTRRSASARTRASCSANVSPESRSVFNTCKPAGSARCSLIANPPRAASLLTASPAACACTRPGTPPERSLTMMPGESPRSAAESGRRSAGLFSSTGPPGCPETVAAKANAANAAASEAICACHVFPLAGASATLTAAVFGGARRDRRRALADRAAAARLQRRIRAPGLGLRAKRDTGSTSSCAATRAEHR